MYKANDVCIVGRGGIFAGTWSAEEFIESLYEGRSSITDMRESKRSSFPWDVNLVYNEDRKAKDQSYTPYGAFIDREKLEALVTYRGGDWQDLTTIQAVAVEALRSACEPVKHLKVFKNAELILGVSTIDTEAMFQTSDQIVTEVNDGLKIAGMADDEIAKFKAACGIHVSGWQSRKPHKSYVIASSLGHCLKEAFGFKGAAMLVDAACASSHAAIHIAMKRLQQREADMIITGGADVSVSPGCLVFFSRLGAMSAEPNAPFDKSASGLTQGEGSGLFALMRLADAQAAGLKIYGVLKSCEGSSDGRSSAIVEPTVEGQVAAYQRAYAAAGIGDVDYIEAHGTGTQLGDRIEIESLNRQFPKKKIPIGTVKANIGHTIAAAGAAGLLKSIGIFERRMIPLATHFKTFPDDVKTNLFLSTKNLPIETNGRPITIGQSAFGFGGSNFHLVVQEYREELKVEAEPISPPAGVVICGSRTFSVAELGEFAKESKFKFPPNILPHVEKLQIASVHLAERTFEELNILPHLLDRERVAVISSSMIPLEGYWTGGHRVVASAIRRLADSILTAPDSRAALAKAFEKIEACSIEVTEDTLSGFLNNIVAGRVCNAFDFKGVSFNIDSEATGWAAAMRTAHSLLLRQHGMVVLISCNDNFIEQELRIERASLTCTVLANATYALEHDLPIEEILADVRFIDDDAAAVELRA